MMSHHPLRFDVPPDPTECEEAVAGIEEAVRRNVCEPINRIIEDSTAQFVSDAVHDAARSFGESFKSALGWVFGETDEET